MSGNEDDTGVTGFKWRHSIGDPSAHVEPPYVRVAETDTTLRLIHPSVISGARAELGTRQPDAVHLRLGEEAPDVVDLETLHIAQRWHGIKADAYLMQGRATDAVAHSLAGLELGVAHGDDDYPDQHLYIATLFCIFAEASRHANQVSNEILEGLREFINAASGNTSRPITALLRYAERTFDLARRGRTRGTVEPLSIQFELPF